MSSTAWARLVLSSATLYWLTVWHRAVESFGTVVVPSEWSIVLALNRSRTVAACLHVLHALTALPARTSCRPMMALMSGALETCARALGTCVSSCTGRPARLFFMLKARGPQGAVGYVAASEPTLAGRWDPEP
jgi:hypothetical protein